MTSDSWTPVESHHHCAERQMTIEIGRQMPIARVRFMVFDKGYCDYTVYQTTVQSLLRHTTSRVTP